MRLSRQQLLDNETKIRTAMNRLLNGDLPPGGKCDIKTLAREASFSELGLTRGIGVPAPIFGRQRL